MDEVEAKDLLGVERARLEELLRDTADSGADDRSAVNDRGDMNDSAEPLVAEQTHDAVAANLRDRLEAIERAEARLAAGTFGRSVRSGIPIPDDRLRADPAAELTVEEAAGAA